MKVLCKSQRKRKLRYLEIIWFRFNSSMHMHLQPSPSPPPSPSPLLVLFYTNPGESIQSLVPRLCVCARVKILLSEKNVYEKLNQYLGLVGPVTVFCGWARWISLPLNFCLSVAARMIVQVDPSLKSAACY